MNLLTNIVYQGKVVAGSGGIQVDNPPVLATEGMAWWGYSKGEKTFRVFSKFPGSI